MAMEDGTKGKAYTTMEEGDEKERKQYKLKALLRESKRVIEK